MGIQCVQHWEDIGIGKDVKTVLMKEDITTVVLDPCRERGGPPVLRLRLDHERIPQGSLRNLSLPRGSAEAVRRKRGLPVGSSRDLGVLGDMIVGARHDANAVCMRVVRKLAEIWNEIGR